MKPIIGVTAQTQENLYDYKLQPVYITAILQAGGIPVVLPIVPVEEVEEVLDLVDGVVMTGGWDIDPDYYGEEPRPETGRLNFDMDKFDSTVVKQVIARDMPFFGTCRGMQMLNVVTGGTLYQSVLDQLDSPVKHNQDHGREFPVHHVDITGGKILAPLLENGRTRVNSSHNQGVKKVGKDVTVAAKAPDGLVEAIELEGKRFILGTQWHPENFAVAGHAPSKELFSNFIHAALDYREAGR